MNFPRKRLAGFTLVELLTVIAILAILMGLLIPAMNGIKEKARATQAKSDLGTICTAVKAYYTEYQKYPLAPSSEQGHDVTFTKDSSQDELMNVLRASGQGRDNPAGTGDQNENPRRIVYLSVNYAKNPATPTGGIVPTTGAKYVGMFVDPWGIPYCVRIDGDYDNKLANPYSSYNGSAAPQTLSNEVIAWSFGKDKASTSDTTRLDPKTGSGSLGDPKTTAGDDIVSWQ